MLESTYTSNVTKKLPSDVYCWKINDNYAGGVPDTFYRQIGGNGKPLWVEYKFLKTLPLRDDTLVKPKLSKQQLIWLQQAVSSGEQALVIVGVENEKVDKTTAGFILEHHEWIEGIPVEQVKKRLKGYHGLSCVIKNLINN